MENKLKFIPILLLLSAGCFDMFKEQEKNIIGNISVINSESRKNDGYRMVIYANNFNKTLLDANYVQDIKGNDSVLFVKCISEREYSEVFYMVRHDKGMKIISVNPIKVQDYLSRINSSNYKYSFHSVLPTCP
jgi:hypothetical protein